MFLTQYETLSVHLLEHLAEDEGNNKCTQRNKQVALIMLIIALQFDVSTSFNM